MLYLLTQRALSPFSGSLFLNDRHLFKILFAGILRPRIITSGRRKEERKEEWKETKEKKRREEWGKMRIWPGDPPAPENLNSFKAWGPLDHQIKGRTIITMLCPFEGPKLMDLNSRKGGFSGFPPLVKSRLWFLPPSLLGCEKLRSGLWLLSCAWKKKNAQGKGSLIACAYTSRFVFF